MGEIQDYFDFLSIDPLQGGGTTLGELLTRIDFSGETFVST
jgi:hypothetical protein